jgi:hypothetical protein
MRRFRRSAPAAQLACLLAVPVGEPARQPPGGASLLVVLGLEWVSKTTSMLTGPP